MLIVAAALALTLAQRGTPQPLQAPPDVAAPPADATKTASGLATKVVTPGTGKDHPTREDIVIIHYTAWAPNGKMLDSSVARGTPQSYPMTRFMPGLSEGLQLMVTGEKRRLWIPESLTNKGTPGAPKGNLVYDVELISIPNKAPSDVKAPPSDAKKTASGLAYKVLKPGTGGRHPKETDKVTVHYTGWTTDGKMFDSTVVRSRPETFPLNGVIAGWTEGLQLMVEGEKTRFWIPEKLAYKHERPPFGLLVFDIELIKIQ